MAVAVNSEPPRVARWVLGWIALVAFLDTFAIVPLLAPYAKESLGASAQQAGLMIALYSLANLLGNFGSGIIIDRYGRRTPMIASLLIASGLILLYAFVRTPTEMMVLRVLHGLSGAVFVPAMFAMVGEYGGQQRVRAMGTTGVLIGLVALLGPVISGLLAKYYGMGVVFGLVAGLMAVAGLAGFALKEQYVRPERSTPIHPLEVMRLPLPMAMFALTFAMTFVMGVLTFALPVRLGEAGYDSAYRGRMFGMLALVAVVLMALVRGRKAFGGGAWRALVGVAFLMMGAVGLDWLPIPLGTWLSVLLYGIGFGLTFPAVHLVAYEGASSHLRGTALAVLHAFYSLGYTLGPATAGAMDALSGTVGAGFALLLFAFAFGLIQRERVSA